MGKQQFAGGRGVYWQAAADILRHTHGMAARNLVHDQYVAVRQHFERRRFVTLLR